MRPMAQNPKKVLLSSQFSGSDLGTTSRGGHEGDCPRRRCISFRCLLQKLNFSEEFLMGQILASRYYLTILNTVIISFILVLVAASLSPRTASAQDSDSGLIKVKKKKDDHLFRFL